MRGTAPAHLRPKSYRRPRLAAHDNTVVHVTPHSRQLKSWSSPPCHSFRLRQQPFMSQCRKSPLLRLILGLTTSAPSYFTSTSIHNYECIVNLCGGGLVNTLSHPYSPSSILSCNLFSSPSVNFFLLLHNQSILLPSLYIAASILLLFPFHSAPYHRISSIPPITPNVSAPGSRVPGNRRPLKSLNN